MDDPFDTWQALEQQNVSAQPSVSDDPFDQWQSGVGSLSTDPQYNPLEAAQGKKQGDTEYDLAKEIHDARSQMDHGKLVDLGIEPTWHQKAAGIPGQVLKFGIGIPAAFALNLGSAAAQIPGLVPDLAAKKLQTDAILAEQKALQSSNPAAGMVEPKATRIQRMMDHPLTAQEIADLKSGKAKKEVGAAPDDLFAAKVEDYRRNKELESGRVQDVGAQAEMAKALGFTPTDVTLSPEQQKNEGVETGPVEKYLVDAAGNAQDPMNLAYGAAPGIPGVSAALKGTGAVIEKGSQLIGSGLKKAGGKIPATASKVIGGTLGASGLVGAGAAMYYHPEAAGIGLGLGTLLALAPKAGTFLREAGELAGGQVPSETAGALGIRAKQALASAVGGAAIGGAAGVAQGDTTQGLLSGFAFGGVGGAIGGNARPVQEAAKFKASTEHGATLSTGNPEVDATHNAIMSTFSPETQDKINSMRSALSGNGTNVVVTNQDGFNQALASNEQPSANGARGVYAGDDQHLAAQNPDGTSTIYLNADAIGGEHAATDTAGHEVGHAVEDYLSKSGADGAAQALRGAVDSALTPEDKASIAQAYGEELSKNTGEASGGDVVSENIAEITRKILANEDISKFGLPKTLTEKIKGAVSNFFGAQEGDSAGMNWGTKDVAKARNLIRDQLYDMGQRATEVRQRARDVAAGKVEPSVQERQQQIDSRLSEIGAMTGKQVTPSILKERGDLLKEAKTLTDAENERRGVAPTAAQEPQITPSEPPAVPAQSTVDRGDVKKALQGLGYPAKAASQLAESAQGSTVEEMVKHALAQSQSAPKIAPSNQTKEAVSTPDLSNLEVPAAPAAPVNLSSFQAPNEPQAAPVVEQGNQTAVQEPPASGVPDVPQTSGDTGIPETDQVEQARAKHPEGTPVRASIDTLDAARETFGPNGKPGKVVMVKGYESAQKKQTGFGEEERSGEIQDQSADKRKAGAKGTQQDKPFIPAEIRMNAKGEPYATGYDVDVQLSNLRHAKDFMRENGITDPLEPVKGEIDPSTQKPVTYDQKLEDALAAYNWNHNHGFDGAGLKRLRNPGPDYRRQPPSQDAQPRPLAVDEKGNADAEQSQKIADLLNLSVNAKPSDIKGPEADKAVALNLENQGFLKENETNKLRSELEDKGFDVGKLLSKRSAFNGRLSPELIRGGVEANPSGMAEKSVRPHGFDIDLNRAFEHGKPQFETTMAGFMPGDLSQFNPENSPSNETDQTKSPEFKKWFGQSKITGSDDTPKILWHGSSSTFNEFNVEGIGSHLGTKEQALEFGRNPKEFYLSSKRPLRLTDSPNWSVNTVRQKLFDKGIIDDEQRSSIGGRDTSDAFNALKEAIEAKGYDSIVYRNKVEGRDLGRGSDSYIALRPQQIKSATENIGTFDSANPDVRFMPGDLSQFNPEETATSKELTKEELKTRAMSLFRDIKGSENDSEMQLAFRKYLQPLATPGARPFDQNSNQKYLLKEYGKIYKEQKGSYEPRVSIDEEITPWTPENGGRLYHGTMSPDFNQLDGEVHLAHDPNETRLYAAGSVGTNLTAKKSGQYGNPRILAVDAAPGKIKDINDLIGSAIDSDGEIADAIQKGIKSAKNKGYRYVVFDHPGISGEFDDIVSLYPKEDLRINSTREMRDVNANVPRFMPGDLSQFNPEENSTSKETKRTNLDSFMPGAKQDELGFYSHLANVIDEKVPNRAKPDQILATLKGANVKQDEMDSMGLPEFLKSHDGPVTKQELQDFVKAGGVQLHEVAKTDDVTEPTKLYITRNESSGKEQEFDSKEDQDKWREDWIEKRKNKWLDDMEVYGGDGEHVVRDSSGYESEPFESEADAEEHRQENAQENAESDYDERFSHDVSESEPPYDPQSTKFSQYSIPGGTDYKEINLVLPRETNPNVKDWEIPEGHQYAGDDLSNKRQIARIRQADHTDTEGNKVRLIEEIQSDRQQAARRDATVPDAPFKATDAWAGLAFKRALRMAVDDGMDKIAWTKGEQQSERYDLSKQISEIRYAKDAGSYLIRAFDKSGDNTVIDERVPESKLEDYVGKEVAQKIINGDGSDRGASIFKGGTRDAKSLSGIDLKVGGEGMKGFYDKILPEFVKKYVKKWGGRVEETELPTDGKATTVHSVTITPQMREAVMQGQPMFMPGDLSQFQPAPSNQTNGTPKRTWFVRGGQRVYHRRDDSGKFAPEQTLANFVD